MSEDRRFFGVSPDHLLDLAKLALAVIVLYFAMDTKITLLEHDYARDKEAYASRYLELDAKIKAVDTRADSALKAADAVDRFADSVAADVRDLKQWRAQGAPK